jgi:hypothetical protein
MTNEVERVVKCHGFIAPRGYSMPDPPYISRFGFVWWFWFPRLHIQKYEVCRGYANPMVIRIIWLCFAFGVDIGREGQIDI